MQGAIPDPTTAGDFCRRFDENAVWLVMEAINDVRVEVWQMRGAPRYLLPLTTVPTAA